MLKRILVYTICLSLSLAALAEPRGNTENCLRVTTFAFSAMATLFNILAAIHAKKASDDIENTSGFTGQINAKKSQKATLITSAASAGLSGAGMLCGATPQEAGLLLAVLSNLGASFAEFSSVITSAIALGVVDQHGNIDIGNFAKTMGFSAAAFVSGVISLALSTASSGK